MAATTLLIGTQVKLVQPVIEGVITDIQYDRDANSLSMLVEYSDGDGEQQSRWFTEAQLEAVK